MSKAKGATPRTSPNTLSFFAAMLVGVLLTLGIGLFVYLWNPFKVRYFLFDLRMLALWKKLYVT